MLEDNNQSTDGTRYDSFVEYKGNVQRAGRILNKTFYCVIEMEGLVLLVKKYREAITEYESIEQLPLEVFWVHVFKRHF